jgi:chloramphenicol O-acetyltransferase type B
MIDMETWKRRIHCQIFRNAVQPHYDVTVELDVTSFYKAVKEHSWPFSLAFIYAVTKCANEIEEFRYRFLGESVVLYDAIDTSFTYMEKEDELFKVVNVPIQENIEDYLVTAKKIISEQKDYFTGPIEQDVYQFSALPWLAYTHVSHTDSGNNKKANPMFDWGKFREKNGRFMMPFSIEVHHSFVDGYHVGKLVDSLQNFIDRM